MKSDKVGFLIDQFQSRGKYFFAIKEVLDKTGQPTRAARRSLERLQQKGRVILVTSGFYIIIPLEYKESRVLPAEWFIHQLMEYLNLPYYVGLLSAAALHGSAHQRPQEFQVIISKQRRQILVNGLRIRFLMKKNLDFSYGTVQMKTETGFICVSSPELTAIDLLKHVRAAGGLSNISTVFSELGERIGAEELVKIARKEKSFVYIQRLGYLFDHLGFEPKTRILARWLSRKKIRPVLLDSSHKKGNSLFNEKWKLFENRKIDAETL